MSRSPAGADRVSIFCVNNIDGVSTADASGSEDIGTNGLEFIMAVTSAIRVVSSPCIRQDGFIEKKGIQNALCNANHPLPCSTHMGRVGRIKGPGALVVLKVSLEVRILCVEVELPAGSSEMCTSI